MTRTLPLLLAAALASIRLIAVPAAENQPNATDNTAATSTDQPPESKEDAGPPYRIPEGSPAEVLKAVETLARAPASSVEQLRRKCQAIIGGAEKILAAQPDDDLAAEAIEWRFSALDALARYEDPAARRRLEALVGQLKDDDRPRVAAVARRYDLDLRSGTLGDASPDKQREFLDEVLTYFETAEVSGGNLRIMLATGLALADSGDAELAIKAYRRFAVLAGRSDDPQVRMVARQQFGTMLDRLVLMGKPLEVSGETFDGKKFDVSEYRGKVVLVDFWATWCAPCVAEMPNLKKHYAKYRDRGFEIVGVNVEADRENVGAFLKESRLPWKTLFDDDPRYEEYGHPVAAKYDIVALPTLLLLDRTGKVVSVTAHGPRLTRWLDKLLGAPDSVSTEP